MEHCTSIVNLPIKLGHLYLMRERYEIGILKTQEHYGISLKKKEKKEEHYGIMIWGATLAQLVKLLSCDEVTGSSPGNNLLCKTG